MSGIDFSPQAKMICVPSQPVVVRRKRRSDHALRERLAKCEELLNIYDTARRNNPSLLKSPRIPDSLHQEGSSVGKLIIEDGVVRFMDSFHVTVHDELRAMTERINDEDKMIGIDPINMTLDENCSILLGLDSPEIHLEDLRPEPERIFGIWQIYLDRVSPLTKVVHVPTVQPYLVEASGNSYAPPKNIEALLFSIFTLATVALSPEECFEIVGCSREEAIRKFSEGVRLCLIRMNFIKHSDTISLQAFVIYLVNRPCFRVRDVEISTNLHSQISLQTRYDRHANWILNGAAIRIAQKMGLHRDGELLNLSPFETEMRRRLWWQIITLDFKYAIFSGLSHFAMPRGWDTQAPRNVNDVDLFPSSTTPVRNADGPTEMIVVLLNNATIKFFLDNPVIEVGFLYNGLDGLYGKSAGSTQMHEYQQLVQRLDKLLTQLLESHCHPAAGLPHVLAPQMKTHLMQQLISISTQPTDHSQERESENSKGHKAFGIALMVVEHYIEQYKQMSHTKILWFIRLHFQLDVFVYLVGRLSHYTSGPDVERAWTTVEEVYHWHSELLDTTHKPHRTLAILTLQAWDVRERMLRDWHSVEPEAPSYIIELRLKVAPIYD